MCMTRRHNNSSSIGVRGQNRFGLIRLVAIHERILPQDLCQGFKHCCCYHQRMKWSSQEVTMGANKTENDMRVRRHAFIYYFFQQEKASAKATSTCTDGSNVWIIRCGGLRDDCANFKSREVYILSSSPLLSHKLL